MVVSRVPIGLLSALALASCGVANEDCDAGARGCECLLGTCEPGLVCSVQNVCVFPGGNTTATTAGSATGVTTAGGGPPVVESVVADPTLIDEWTQTTVTATVTDPDGPDDVVAGILTRLDNMVSVGTFENQGNGQWTAVVSWEAIDSVGDLQNGTLALVATFTDSGAGQGEAVLNIDTCDDGHSNCSGTCTDVLGNDNANCGACGAGCGETCIDGECCWYDYDYGLYCADGDPEPPFAGAGGIPQGEEPLSLTSGPAELPPLPDGEPLSDDIVRAFSLPRSGPAPR